MANRFLKLSEVTHLTGLARSTIYEMMEAGTFPRPLKIGPKAVRWRLDIIEQWMDSFTPPQPPEERSAA